jgi:hypothetical protein
MSRVGLRSTFAPFEERRRARSWPLDVVSSPARPRNSTRPANVPAAGAATPRRGATVPKGRGDRVRYTMYRPPGLVSPGACIRTQIGTRCGVGMSPRRVDPSHRVVTRLLGHRSRPVTFRSMRCWLSLGRSIIPPSLATPLRNLLTSNGWLRV